MDIKKRIFYVLIGAAVCSFTPFFLKGCGHQNEQTLKKMLSKKKNAIIHVQKIKEKLFQKYDSIESFTVENTGRAFRLSRRKYGEVYDQSVFVSYYLTDQDSNFFESFMDEENIYYLHLYRNREVYSFVGYDCMYITDGTYKDGGIEIAKNVYFKPRSMKKE